MTWVGIPTANLVDRRSDANKDLFQRAAVRGRAEVPFTAVGDANNHVHETLASRRGDLRDPLGDVDQGRGVSCGCL